MRKLLSLLASLSWLVPGCMVGPDFHEPKTLVRTGWIEANDPAVLTKRVEYRDWWAAFRDPVLSELVAISVP
jgi:outer membrane protein TolC